MIKSNYMDSIQAVMCIFILLYSRAAGEDAVFSGLAVKSWCQTEAEDSFFRVIHAILI